MQVEAITRNIRMSAQKVREVTRQIQGLPALQALAILAVVPRKSARLVARTLESAIANAAHFQTEWADKAETAIADRERQLQNTTKKKRKNKLNSELAKYRSFADSKNRLAPESLIVKFAEAGQATSIKRFRPRARGSAGPILKRTSHIKIVLSDE